MYKTVVIDDEENARKVSINILENFCNDIVISGTGYDVKSGIQIIRSAKPDIVFLDIEMPDGTGFNLLEQLSKSERSFSLIFATGHNDFALKAFKYNAVDYILKPADIQDVILAIEKAKKQINPQINGMLIQQLLSSVKEKETKKLVLKTSDDIYIVNIEDIVRCQAEGGYTTFFIKDGKKILISRNLKEYEAILKSFYFIRTHNSHLVNLNFVEKYRKTEGGCLIMKDKSQIPVSVRKKEAVLQKLKNLSKT